jgi:phosphatidylinositol alpha-mannosyltransferase
VARRILAVYETVVLPGAGEVTASEDDDELPALPEVRNDGDDSGDAPLRTALRRWVQR